MYHSFTVYVGDFPSDFCGFDVVRLMLDMEACFAELLAVKGGYPHGLELDPAKIPVIHAVKTGRERDHDATGSGG